jgi:hypothetical protein
MLWLAVVTALLVVLAGVILAIADISINGEQGFIEGAWAALLRTLDPGTMGGDAGWPFRIIALVVTLGGVFIVSTLIGLIATAMSQKLEELRKGRSPVIESGHTLILGWSPKLMTVITELMIANENEDYSAVVVMSHHDKVWMEDQIREKVDHNGKTRVICRTGDVSDPGDLDLVDPMRSKAVIVLSPEGERSDADVIRTVLALMQHDLELDNLNVVVEMIDEKNAEALGMAVGGRVTTVVSSDVIARITAQVCRQSGLSAVYQDLLDFAGDEIYFARVPETIGMTFGTTLVAFESSSILGLRFADGRIELNPPMDTVLAEGDAVIAIAEDDDKIVFTGAHETTVDVTDRPPNPELEEEHLLIVGWNFFGPRLLDQLNNYLAEGSEVHILYDPAYVDDPNVNGERAPRLRLTAGAGDTSQEGPLRRAFEERSVDHVIVLCYRNGLSVAESDARTLMTLLQLRRIAKTAESRTDSDISIVTELLDVKDVQLARVANPDDFVVSEQLASLLITQLAENPELGAVFADLFDSFESELMLKPARMYVPLGKNMPFADIVSAARGFQEIAIGYRRHGRGADDGEIVINPAKSKEIELTERDSLIVLTTA